MAEEFCRFKLNSQILTDRAKAIRHRLCAIIGRLDAGRLLASRDTYGDVGAARQIEEQIERNNLEDCFTAACKRLTEALRVLGEMSATFDKADSELLEKLRFEAYAFEKDVALFADTVEKFGRAKLYVIITSNLPADIMNLTNQCIRGGADCIQLRAKQMPDDQLFATALEMVELCRNADVISIINDRVDIAVAAGTDGVHLGQNDLPVDQARKLAKSPIIIGKSTHSIDQLERAITELPTYVGLGPVFSTGTKPGAEAVGLVYVSKATAILEGSGIKHVAIGGITLDNVKDVLGAGAQAVAVCSAVTKVENPIEACKKLKQKIL